MAFHGSAPSRPRVDRSAIQCDYPMELYRCYRVLGLNPGASVSEVRLAFKRLALEYHPDRNRSPEAELVFKTITEAYATILGSQGVEVPRHPEERVDIFESVPGKRLAFTIFTDKEVVHSVPKGLFEHELRKCFNPKFAPGTFCKVGRRWFQIDVESRKGIPLVGWGSSKRKTLIEWYKSASGADKWKRVTWEDFWAYVHNLVAQSGAPHRQERSA